MPYQNYLGVINTPNARDTACDFVQNGLALDSEGTSLYGLPTFNQSYFYKPALDFTYEENCSDNTYHFRAKDTFGATNYLWRFEYPENQSIETVSGKQLSYTFPYSDSMENQYKITLIASNGSYMDSISKTLTIRPVIETHFLGRDTFYCEK